MPVHNHGPHEASEPSPAPGIHPWTLASDEVAPAGPAVPAPTYDGFPLDVDAINRAIEEAKAEAAPTGPDPTGESE